jgi:hypothetical protein
MNCTQCGKGAPWLATFADGLVDGGPRGTRHLCLDCLGKPLADNLPAEPVNEVTRRAYVRAAENAVKHYGPTWREEG